MDTVMHQGSSEMILLLRAPNQPIAIGSTLWEGRILDNCQGMAIALINPKTSLGNPQMILADFQEPRNLFAHQ